MRANAEWWQLQMNPNDRSKDQQIESRIQTAITANERWTDREPTRAEAWFFRGAAYAIRVEFRVLRGSRLAAARDGKRIKEALERALALDPTMQDAYFGIGLYHYYAGIAPGILKVVAWLLALPGGNRAQGLQEMWRARNKGDLLRGEVDFQLALLDLWFEHKTDEALTLLGGLRRTYPHNPVFLQVIADAQDTYRHDHAASLEAWTELDTLARERRVGFPEMCGVRARIGMATQLDAMGDRGRAVDLLRAVVASRPSAPYGALALAHLKLASALDRLGQRGPALDAYRAAIAAAPSDDPDHVRDRAREGLDHPPGTRSSR
jgi:tetratricopeptide (TPR) repeat protein